MSEIDCTINRNEQICCENESNLRVINIGLQHFYEALADQKIKVTQLEWRPPMKLSEELTDLLDIFL